ncbi:MAG: UPF0175 family protein [Spirochaetota bacterium]
MRLTINIPDSAFSSIWVTPEEYVKEMEKAATVKWYEMRKITQDKAAEICGVTRAEFIKVLSEYKVSVLQDDETSLHEELDE